MPVWPSSPRIAVSGAPWTRRSRRSGPRWPSRRAAMAVPLPSRRAPDMDRKRRDDDAVDDAAVESVEKQVDEWRAYLRRSRAITTRDVAELEDHLREQMATLGGEGLALDEAFLVAVKRMGAVDALTREFAR